MTVTLTSARLPIASIVNSASATRDATGLLVVNAAAQNTWLCRFDQADLQAGQVITLQWTLRVPAGYTSAPYQVSADVMDASLNLLYTTGFSAATPVVAGGDPVVIQMPIVVPAGGVVAYTWIFCGASAANRRVIASCQFVSTATVDDVLSIALDRPLNRLADDSGGARTPLIASGPPGSRQGVLTCLVSSITAANPLDILCQYGQFTIPADVFGDVVTLWPTKLKLSSERPLPGRPAKFLATIDVKEA